MISVVLDTNSLIVSVPKRSEFRPIFDALIDGHFQLLISTEILNEYAEKLEEVEFYFVTNRRRRWLFNNYIDYLNRFQKEVFPFFEQWIKLFTLRMLTKLP